MKMYQIALCSLLTACIALPAQALTADEIMQRVDALAKPAAVRSTLTMVLVDSRGKQRVRELQSTRINSAEVDKSLMFFLAPADVRGTGFLLFDYQAAEQDDDQWMYLPALRKAKRIGSSDKTGSFMGSDFSYADMSKRNLAEWTYQLVKQDRVGELPVWVIESTPINQAVRDKTGYARSIGYIRQDNYQLIRAINYLPQSGALKLLNVSESIEIDGFWFATETQMVAQKDGQTVHRTLLKITNIELDGDVDDNDFSLNRLEQGL